MTDEKTPNEKMHTLLTSYLDKKIYELASELEIRFGTRGIKPITHIDYDNVIKKLISSGFYADGEQIYDLRVQNEYIDERTGKTFISDVRTEISGLSNIQTYCRTNNIADINNSSIKYTKKKTFKNPEGGSVLPINFDDWNFRVALQQEINILPTSNIIHNIRDSWKDNKKTFRYLNRLTYLYANHCITI